MINILIDTCSWQNLLTDKTENRLLYDLQKLCNNNHVKIITHEIIIKEWNRNKIIEKENLSKSIRAKFRNAKEVYQNQLFDAPLILNPDLKHIDKQVEAIDLLLENAVKLITSDKVKAICSDKSLNQKAPYHNKKTSTADAYIIYSALDYFQKSKKTFCFVSDNKNDFADLNSNDRKIHPDILELHNDCEIDYYVKIDRAISDFRKIFHLNIPVTVDDKYSKIYSGKFLIDTSKNILDQVYDYLKIMFKEFTYVPVNLLLANPPFKTHLNSTYPYYSLFTLHIEDTELFELFEGLISSDKREIIVNAENFANHNKESSDKLKYILRTFQNNLIYHIAHKNSNNQEIEIKLKETDNCNCAKCSFRRLNLFKFFNSIRNYDETPCDLIEQGYLFYKMGNYVEAVNVYELAYKISRENDNFSLAFIAKYNLSKLSSFVGNFWNEIPNRDELLKKLKKISVIRLLPEHKTLENQAIIEWVANEKFFTTYRNKIQETTQKIIERYYSSLNKGRGSNSFVWTLINDYSECISFLETNKIIYDQFSEFYQLNKVFTEGILASHAIKRPHNSRLLSFSDWILRQLIFNGEAEHILKTANRYKIKQIEYSSEDGDNSFKSLATNFFTYDPRLWKEYKKNQIYRIRVFEDYYNRLYSNVLTLLALCDLDNKFINDLIPNLMKFHQKEEVINWHKIKYLRLFLSRKGDIITLKNLRLFFKQSLYIGKTHEEGIIETISEIVISRNSSIIVTQKDFNQILNLAFDECNICSKRHASTIVIPFLRVLANKQFKIKLQKKLLDNLTSNFNFDLYYRARIYDLIPNDRNLFKLAIKESVPMKIIKRPSVFIFDESPINRKLNDLINLCFKNNVNLNQEPFLKVKMLSPYYNWLIDMNNFNYKLFKVEWITEYSTKFYYNRMANCTKLKVAIEIYLANNIDNLIEKYYLDIYVRRAWDRD